MKTKNFKNYLKLIGVKIAQALRTIGTVVSGIGMICVLMSGVMNYAKIKEFPKTSHFIFFIVCLVVFIVLNTMKKVCEEKVIEINTRIERNKELKKHKDELKYRYEHKLAETQIQQEAFETEKELISVKKFDITKITKADVNGLNSLIGLQSVKEQINKFRATIDYEKKYGGSKSNSIFHLKFIGNPGTGKTTVAKVMAAILYDAGIISKPKYIAVNGNDLMGKYTGQTAPTVDALFRQGSQGLIFIDEAYGLFSAANDSGSGYGYEAVNQLLTHLENDNKTVVIFGGYEEPMERFFDMNPGLRSRVPLTLQFSDYNEDELLQILELNLKTKGHTLSEETKPILRDLFLRKIKLCNNYNLPFSNGRYARTVANELHSQHAVNYFINNEIGTVITSDDVKISTLLSLD